MTHLDFDLNIRSIKSVYMKTYGVVSFSTKRVIRFDAKEALRYDQQQPWVCHVSCLR